MILTGMGHTQTFYESRAGLPHTFKPRTWEGRQGDHCESRASLGYTEKPCPRKPTNPTNKQTADRKTMTGLHVPESFVSETGSRCLRLHLPASHGAVTGSDPDR